MEKEHHVLDRVGVSNDAKDNGHATDSIQHRRNTARDTRSDSGSEVCVRRYGPVCEVAW